MMLDLHEGILAEFAERALTYADREFLTTLRTKRRKLPVPGTVEHRWYLRQKRAMLRKWDREVREARRARPSYEIREVGSRFVVVCRVCRRDVVIRAGCIVATPHPACHIPISGWAPR